MTNLEALFGVTYNRGEVIFRQGDNGDIMYVIQSGAVEIKQTRKKREVVLGIFEAGDIFGEMALFGNQLRTATVTALQTTRLLSISRQSLFERVASDPEIIFYLMKTVCWRIDKTNQLLKKLIKSDERIRTSLLNKHSTEVKDHLVARTEEAASNIPADVNIAAWLAVGGAKKIIVAENETIFSKGDDGHTMFIIIDGLVEINQSVDDARYIIAYLGVNDYFGEISLLSDLKRTANVVAVRPTTLLSVSKKNLLEKLHHNPDFSFNLLMLLMQRLRRIIDAMEEPTVPESYPRLSMPTFIRKIETLKVGIYSLSACSACTTVLFDNPRILSMIRENAKVVYCQMLMDEQELGKVDIAVVDGLVRTKENVELIEEIREKSGKLIAWGTCACFGGIPAMANDFELEDLLDETFGDTLDLYSYYLSGSASLNEKSYTKTDVSLLRRAWKINDFARVDYYLPG